MHPPVRVAARPSPAIHAALIAMAAALWLLASSAPAADAPSQPGAPTQSTIDKTITINTSPPSVRVDVGPADEKDNATEDTGNRSKGSRRHIRVEGSDIDFGDDFSRVMHTAPWIVGLVFLIVGSIFLTPVILLIGIIWYKLRKTRLQNEAWLKLAEKGVVPPTRAADAVTSGLPPPDANAAMAGSIVQQTVATRRRAVWSDLRKGVVMITIGLAFSAYSLLNDREPNWIGLVLLFLGVGYLALWWLEERRLAQRDAGGGPD